MLFSLEQGPHVEAIVEMSMRQGTPLPKKIANAPELLYGLEFYMTAFYRLSSGRNSGWGVGKISWLQVEEYCDRMEVYGSQRDIMHYHIQNLDQVYLEFQAKKEK